MDISYFSETNFAVTICDKNGVILYMNQKSAKTFAKDGGMDLIGKNLLECHPEPARSVLKELIANKASNNYTIEKNGIKKLISQNPWFENGEYMGHIELSIEIPLEMKHFVRK